jgi:hypothetical protein
LGQTWVWGRGPRFCFARGPHTQDCPYAGAPLIFKDHQVL